MQEKAKKHILRSFAENYKWIWTIFRKSVPHKGNGHGKARLFLYCSLKFISANKGLPRAILFHDIYVSLSPAYPLYPLYPLSLYNQCWIAKIVLKQRLITIFGGSPLNP